jgi:RNA polymerase sigma-70 factor (ECF subfamily)
MASDQSSIARPPVSPDDEPALVERLRQGDAEAFETLVRTQGGRMLAVARRLVGNDEAARDVVQDALFSAFRSIKRFEGNSRLSTWLHRITVNTALMRLRTQRRRPEESIEPLLPTFIEDGHHASQFASWEGADALLERSETRQLVRDAIDRLPESYRTVLVLRDIEQLGTEETARLLGLTTNAVKIRLHRGRQALRTLLDPHFGSVRR